MSDDKKEIPESDKPFYLAIVSSVVTGLCIVIGAIGAVYKNVEMIDFATESLKFTFPLTMMSWAFYFKKN